jgi:hypothetical protein
MPLINVQTTVNANSSANPLSGNQYEFMHEPCHVEFAMVTTATGVLATVYSGPDLLMQEGPVQIKAASTLPTYPDDYHLEDDAAEGDRLNVVLRNTTGGNLVVYTLVRITPL